MSRGRAVALLSLLGFVGPLLSRSGAPVAGDGALAQSVVPHRATPSPRVASAAVTPYTVSRESFPAPPPPDPRILVVGDSVLLGARDDIMSRLSMWDVAVDAEVGRSTIGGLDVLRSEGELIGDVVVVHLGHNDGASREVFRDRIDGVMSELSDVEHVLWLDLAEFDDWVAGANAELALATTRWMNLEIIDWSAVAASDPEYLYSDGIHLPPPGRRAMADLVGERIDSWVASRGPAEVRALHLGLDDPGRPRPTGFLPGPPVAVAPFGTGWRTVDGYGHLLSSGGSVGQVTDRDVAAIAASPEDGGWVVDLNGRVTPFGAARHHDDAESVALAARVVGIAATPTGNGYWLASADGGVFAFGDAGFSGAAAEDRRAPVIGIAALPDGRGYWLSTSDGEVLAFGAARSHGDTTSRELTAPIVAITASPSGRGYWLLGADGGVFAFGDAPFRGSVAGADGFDARAVGLVPAADGYAVVTWRPAGVATEQRLGLMSGPRSRSRLK